MLANICLQRYCCRTDLHDLRTIRPIPKNIYLPVQYFFRSNNLNLLSDIYWSFFCADSIIFLGYIEKKRKGCFLMKLTVHSLDELGELCQWHCHDNNTIKIVLSINNQSSNSSSICGSLPLGLSNVLDKFIKIIYGIVESECCCLPCLFAHWWTVCSYSYS